MDDANIMQDCLCRIQSWSNAWQLDISSRKCNFLYCGKQYLHDLPSLLLNNAYIKAVGSFKDLGVIISSGIKFNHHINAIVARAHRVNNLIYKCFHCNDTDVLLNRGLCFCYLVAT